MSISKKIRFEVFKRDNFTCAYCGRTPPAVTLEIDHINPKSRKGKDNINNLITACFDCNRGKKDIPLKKIPTSLKINLEVLKEKEMQLAEYNKFVQKTERRINKQMQEVDDIYNSYFPNYCLSDNFKKVSLKRFFAHLPQQEILDSMNIACSKMNYNKDKAIPYFCGICWNKIKGTTLNGKD